MFERSLQEIAVELANRARAEGCRGVIVAVSRDNPPGVHSSFHIAHHGPCLELEGLQSRIGAVVSKLWEGLIATHKPG
jgi:hypothetical protein